MTPMSSRSSWRTAWASSTSPEPLCVTFSWGHPDRRTGPERNRPQQVRFETASGHAPARRGLSDVDLRQLEMKWSAGSAHGGRPSARPAAQSERAMPAAS